jgi:hypothetical protein
MMPDGAYKPDRWVVLKIKSPGRVVYKVLAGWGGSYLHGQSWKLNSGITKVEEDGDYLMFSGYSGSVYRCHKKCYGITSLTANVLSSFMEQVEDQPGTSVEKMPEDTNFMELIYE